MSPFGQPPTHIKWGPLRIIPVGRLTARVIQGGFPRAGQTGTPACTCCRRTPGLTDPTTTTTYNPRSYNDSRGDVAELPQRLRSYSSDFLSSG